MLGTKLLLEQKIYNLPKLQRKDFLLKNIEKNKILKFREDEFLEDIDLSKNLLINCRICNKSEFIRDKYSEICKNCGYEKNILPTGKSYEKIEYI